MGITIQEALIAMGFDDDEFQDMNSDASNQGGESADNLTLYLNKAYFTLGLIESIRFLTEGKFGGLIDQELDEILSTIELDIATRDLVVSGFGASRIDTSDLSKQGWKLEIRLEPKPMESR
jgi:hypothetical protein